MVGGYVSLLCSIGKKPLDYWSKRQSQTGHVRRILDTELYENVVEIQDLEPTSIANTSIICPSSPRQFLNIALPFMVIVIKYMNVDCRFQLQVNGLG
ncbi:cilia- and flagella-associated protein 20 [Orussus abietinus]|uniref:cilia- and flagella-associated protein 20 n=1 Tax=Orussus abietinus TaxID=222816 RepID=UPI000626C928|nr:cilia- and flagella-associated protein 20 [Orussus abietinus]